jgi:hypothetical protein
MITIEGFSFPFSFAQCCCHYCCWGWNPEPHSHQASAVLLEPLHQPNISFLKVVFFNIYLFIVVLGLELRAFTLSHSTSPIFVKDFLR